MADRPQTRPDSRPRPRHRAFELHWVGEHLGVEVADDALVLAGVLGHPRSPDLTLAEAFERAGEDLVPLLLWLVCGVVATAGEGDVNWLIEFDPDHEPNGDPDQTT